VTAGEGKKKKKKSKKQTNKQIECINHTNRKIWVNVSVILREQKHSCKEVGGWWWWMK
jgi:hypothetical protein